MTNTATETRTVIVERDLPFSPDRIWRALTQPHLMAEWLMQTDFEAKVGAGFRFTTDWGSIDCEVVEIEPQKTLSYTWEAMGLMSVVTWTLVPTGNGTHLRMEQTGFKPDQNQAYNGAKFGWQKFFTSLQELLERTE